MCTWSDDPPWTSSEIALSRVSVNSMPDEDAADDLVYLRALDYFKGLLFLTTNRTGTFDDAFISRIHVKIQYEALDRSTRRQIWENGWDKLALYGEKEGRKIHWSYEAKEYVRKNEDLENLEWNGREIRNGQSSASLGER
jgi:hypothetical protein